MLALEALRLGWLRLRSDGNRPGKRCGSDQGKQFRKWLKMAHE
jgi:hypothetical protein